MSDKNEKQQKPFSSLFPLMILGLGIMFALDFFEEPEKKKETITPQVNTSPVQDTPRQSNSRSDKLNDFVFKQAPKNEFNDKQLVDTGPFLVELSQRGGRISRFYIKHYGNTIIPEAVIMSGSDELAKKNRAMEISYYNGMDFQPHLYWIDQTTNSFVQLDNPPLNEAFFKPIPVKNDPASDIQEVRYSTPITFKGHRLELIKTFRFLKGENFFRQITVIRNLENRPFKLNGSLFFKTFGDVGSIQEAQDLRMPSTRFYYYGDELYQRTLTPGAMGAGGCGGGCGSDNNNEVLIGGNPNTLDFVGTTSRYFLAYSMFMRPGHNPLQIPDGLIMVNQPDPAGRKTQTIYYRHFELAAAQGAPLDLGDHSGNPGRQGKVTVETQSNKTRVVKTQNRTDALVIDNMVFVGLRSDESHSFDSDNIMAAEFGMTEPDENARRAIFSFGYFSYFSRIKDGIVWLMRVLYGMIGNYGWAIIIIAISIKLATFPLTQMQVKSMKRMSELKPEIEKINELYASDPQEKQKKIMEMYRKNKVNPAKGCLPMFIQMPIFIALFSAFSESIELWNSPFIWWMTDLSRPDTIHVIKDMIIMKDVPVNILPVFMIISQVLYQKYNTVTMDPQQRVIMYIMPVAFAFLFWSMPSGVTLYWTVQNLFSIVWQIAANKFSKD